MVGARGWNRRRAIRAGAVVLVGAWAVAFVYGLVLPLPPGTSVEGPLHRGSRVEFLHDLTYRREGERAVEQRIFERVFEMIDAAERFVVIDMFLFNGEHTGDQPVTPLSRMLADRLADKKRRAPNVEVVFVTDEINNFYGAYTSREIAQLRDAGVQVVSTDVTRLRDSNPIYSAAWRAFLQWFGTSGWGWLPHPMTNRGIRVTARSYLGLLNFKANHRKLIVTDRECLVASANPHDASSLHSNIAFAASGAVCNDILRSERGVVAFSGGALSADRVGPADSGDATVQFLTEGKIRAGLLRALAEAGPETRVDVAMFYLSERSIVDELAAAAERGAEVRLILDPNKDAFGREKGGIPNRQVAWELRRRSGGRIAVRWYDTHGEQFHTKLVLLRSGDSVVAFGGSANLTRRNIGDYNLEADVRVAADTGSAVAGQLRDYYDRIWTNRDGHFTVDYDAYEDRSRWKRILYRMQEFSGLCTW